MNSMLLNVGYTMYPDEVTVPKPPNDWVDPSPNITKGGPIINKVDNPGIWSSFYYRPVFASGTQVGQYKFHFILAGFQLVKPHEEDALIFTHGGWNFLPMVKEGGRLGWCEGK